MKKSLIENDIQKMKSLIGYSIGETISEQEEKYGNCSGNNSIKPPVVSRVAFSKNEDGTPKRASIAFTAYFVATVSSEKVYEKALLMVRQELTSRLSKENKNFLNTHNMDVVNIVKVVGSASNFNSYALQPTYNNVGKKYTEGELSQSPFDTLPKVGNTRWDQNLGYAENRWKKLINTINNKGEQIGFTINDNVEPQTIIAKITDTGGCTDEKRNESEYPQPGQYVNITFQCGFSPKPLGEEQKRKVFNCAKGLRVIVGYFKSGAGGETIDGISIPANSRDHGCDFATFDIRCNGVEVGIANMNNGPEFFTGSSKARVGISKSDNPNLVQRISPTNLPKSYGKGESAVNVFSVNDKLLKQMIEKSPKGLLELTIQGKKGTLTRALYHGDAPMVCVYTVDKYGKLLNKIYGPKEPFGKIKGDVGGNRRKLVKFNPCKTI